MTLDATPMMTEPEARRITERIRVALDRVATSWADLADRIGEAYSRRADLAMGYASWEAYANAELKPSMGIAAEVRRELVGLLSAQGMSTRAIAPTVGVSDRRVRQIANEVGNDFPPAAESIDYATGEVIDTSAAAGGGEAPAAAEPRSVGLDGKTYPRPAAIPTADRRRPITDAFWEVAYDLNKKVESLQRLVADDRFKSNAGAISARNYAQLQQTASTLSEVLAALQNHYEESSK